MNLTIIVRNRARNSPSDSHENLQARPVHSGVTKKKKKNGARNHSHVKTSGKMSLAGPPTNGKASPSPSFPDSVSQSHGFKM